MIEPIKYQDLVEVIGKHTDKNGLIIIDTPFPLRLSWEALYVTRVMIHESIAKEFIQALKEIEEYYGMVYIIDRGLDEFGGCYNPRKSRGGSARWSVHSWGMAVDYLPSMGKFRKPAMTPAPIVQAFKRQGFLWGGDWKPADGMHFTGVIE